jgi:hypothetical protein
MYVDIVAPVDLHSFLIPTQVLLQEGAYCGVKNEDGQTPLHVACSLITHEMNLKEIVQVMVSEAKPALDPSIVDKNKKDAKELTRFKSIKKLLKEAGAKCSTQRQETRKKKDKEKKSIPKNKKKLLRACEEGDIEEFEKTAAFFDAAHFEFYEPVNIKDITDDSGNNGMLLASANGHVQLLQLCLNQKDNNPNRRNNRGESALLLACKGCCNNQANIEGWVKCVEVLLLVKVDPSKKSTDGTTPLHALARVVQEPSAAEVGLRLAKLLLGPAIKSRDDFELERERKRQTPDTEVKELEARESKKQSKKRSKKQKKARKKADKKASLESSDKGAVDESSDKGAVDAGYPVKGAGADDEGDVGGTEQERAFVNFPNGAGQSAYDIIASALGNASTHDSPEHTTVHLQEFLVLLRRAGGTSGGSLVQVDGVEGDEAAENENATETKQIAKPTSTDDAAADIDGSHRDQKSTLEALQAEVQAMVAQHVQHLERKYELQQQQRAREQEQEELQMRLEEEGAEKRNELQLKEQRLAEEQQRVEEQEEKKEGGMQEEKAEEEDPANVSTISKSCPAMPHAQVEDQQLSSQKGGADVDHLHLEADTFVEQKQNQPGAQVEDDDGDQYAGDFSAKELAKQVAGAPWEIEYTESVLKWFRKNSKKNRKLCEKVVRRFGELASGYWVGAE